MNILIFLVLAVVNIVVWYYFFYYLLYSIKSNADLQRSAIILVILLSLGIATCPLIISTIFCHMGCAKMMQGIKMMSEKTI